MSRGLIWARDRAILSRQVLPEDRARSACVFDRIKANREALYAFRGGVECHATFVLDAGPCNDSSVGDEHKAQARRDRPTMGYFAGTTLILVVTELAIKHSRCALSCSQSRSACVGCLASP